MVLETQPNNVKAIYRRAKTQIALYNFDEARKDLEKCADLDKALENEVKSLLDHIKKLEIELKKKEMEKFKGKLFA